MANEDLKQVFQDMHLVIAISISPDSVMDALLSKKVLCFDDYYRLRQVPVSVDRCRDMLSLLYISKHPQAFIHFRLGLLDEYSWIVDKIDNKLPSLTSQLQQLQLGQSTDGNFGFSFTQENLNTMKLRKIILFNVQVKRQRFHATNQCTHWYDHW